jgi:hypothetical protein
MGALLASPAAAGVADEAPVGVGGRVLGEADPLSAARVYVYHLADSSIEKTVTDENGHFAFEKLPVGLYKVIAHKIGFLPSVVNLSRAAADAYQFVEMQLARQRTGDVLGGEDFWSVRAEVPADVLREITLDEIRQPPRASGVELTSGLRFRTELQAMSGVDQISSFGDGLMTSGRLGIQGQVGDFQIGLRGNYQHLSTNELGGSSAAASQGQASTLSLDLDNGSETRVRLTSLTNRLDTFDRALAPVDFEHYQVSVSQALGNRARSEVAVQYTNQNNFHRQGLTDPIVIPEASRSWRLQGSVGMLVGDNTSLETGLRYRQRDYETFAGSDFSPLFHRPGDERVDFFGRGGTRVQPRVLVEYGLYTTLLDGSLSLAPQGGLVVDLGSSWKASASASHRVDSGAAESLTDFVPTFFAASGDCSQNEAYCYQVHFTHENDDEDGEISFGAIHREYAETLRLYFSDDFFHRLESLYLVPGDHLPEVQFAFTRRLAPKVLARLESSLAAGGGGIFYAVDREPYENRVRYLVTSLDTQFQGTSTGLFIAFHHLQQQLAPLSSALADPNPMELDRLQLMLTQDLNVLIDIASDWAIQLNMELSRGTDPSGGLRNDDLRKRILGGIAVKF